MIERYINFCSLLDQKDCESVCKGLLLINNQEKKLVANRNQYDLFYLFIIIIYNLFSSFNLNYLWPHVLICFIGNELCIDLSGNFFFEISQNFVFKEKLIYIYRTRNIK